MVETSDDPSLLDRIHSWTRPKAHASNINSPGADHHHPAIALHDRNHASRLSRSATGADGDDRLPPPKSTSSDGVAKASTVLPLPLPPPAAENGDREESSTIVSEHKPNVAIRFWCTAKNIILSSWLNVLLVFVPAGIAVEIAGVNPTVVFAINAIAIIPLAGLLSHATESVARRMGDTVGALMNVTFGNAVELIIFIIALVKNEYRIVQASLLGSILANLLLILGMCFLFGGLRFREQIYNSTVTQMSACLLSLSVMSLLLPTAFHASFTDLKIADKAVLRVSRGTSIILLLVYVLYLLFQLKSHAYMYASTPQHVIDEESHPGVLAEMLGSSSSSDSSSSSEGSDTDASSGSNTTAKRIKRALRGRRRRKSSVSSKDTPSMPSAVRTPSVGTHTNPESPDFVNSDPLADLRLGPQHELGVIASGDEADTDGEKSGRRYGNRVAKINYRDFEKEKVGRSGTKSPEAKPKKKSKTKKKHKNPAGTAGKVEDLPEKSTEPPSEEQKSIPRVGFVQDVQVAPDSSPKRPFNIRGLSVRPALPNLLSSTVFSSVPPAGPPVLGPGAPTTMPRALNGVRRTTSLPDRLNQPQPANPALAPTPQPYIWPVNASHVSTDPRNVETAKEHISRTTAVILLLVSTGLVAICAEFLVGSINYLVQNSGVSEAFVGLIILPIVGNAAEHVTAVTVASKNKMDLAIGVAVGSSIQIALFVTPVIVLLGWILSKDMSLYFSLFETVSLFVSAFIVNFLVLDGRSNYLEGALLIAAYIIIAVAAFFYPDSSQQSPIGGAAADGARRLLVRSI